MAVYDANNLDIEAVKNDGSVELFIISSGKFDDSAEQQTLLLDKISNYIGYALSGWAAVYGVTQSRTRLKRLSSSSSGSELPNINT